MALKSPFSRVAHEPSSPVADGRALHSSPFEEPGLQGRSFSEDSAGPAPAHSEAAACQYAGTLQIRLVVVRLRGTKCSRSVSSPSLTHLCGRRAREPNLTFRSVGGGLLVGSILCCSNTYFGLQTGWITMGSLQACAPLLFLSMLST